MSLIYEIEISNFINVEVNGTPWKPKWVHQRFKIDGLSAAINIPNGKGKSTICISLLSLLAGNRKKLNELRNIFFAPRSSGHCTHFRIETRISQSTTTDLLGHDGTPYVIGMYANAGDGETLRWYCYEGTLDDCPIASHNDNKIRLVGDTDFKERLHGMKGRFPDSKDEGVAPWKARMAVMFDMGSINQLLTYQLASGAEGSNGYFNIKEKSPYYGQYHEGLFYELLAPELLSDLMGAYGEHDEKGIEDTIHEKAGGIIRAKFNSQKADAALAKEAHVLKVMERANKDGKQFAEDKTKFDQHCALYAQEIASLKDILVTNPIAGVPCHPPESLHTIVNMLVLLDQDGKHTWHLPDRAIAMFTGEDAAKVNERAERKGIQPESAQKSQLIEIACDHGEFGRPQGGGKSTKLYGQAKALALLQHTSNFTSEWTREKAVITINEIFDWAEAHADTNPARLRLLQNNTAIEGVAKNKVLEEASIQRIEAEQEKLQGYQKNIGKLEDAYNDIVNSKLFNKEEMSDLVATGKTASASKMAASQALASHINSIAQNASHYENWQRMVAVFKIENGFSDLADQIEETAIIAAKNDSEIVDRIRAERRKDAPLESNERRLHNSVDGVQRKITEIDSLTHHKETYRNLFGDRLALGLESEIRREIKETQQQYNETKSRREVIAPKVAALQQFRGLYGDQSPAEWKQHRLARWGKLNQEITTTTNLLADEKDKLSQLDLNPIAAGRVAKEVMSSAGGNAEPLYEAIKRMQLTGEQRTAALTLFSALLHSPVYSNVQGAERAVDALNQAEIEAPVFVFDHLEAYCQSEMIMMRGRISEGLVLGIRTRQVDCILDPTLVEKEKNLINKKIVVLDAKLVTLNTELQANSPSDATVKIADDANECLDNAYEHELNNLRATIDALEAEILPALKQKEDAIGSIQAVLKIGALLNGQSEHELRELHQKHIQELAKVKEERETLKLTIEQLEADEHDIREVRRKAEGQKATYADSLRRAHAFSIRAYDEINPAYMKASETRRIALSKASELATLKSSFNFVLAADFIKPENQNAKELADKIHELKIDLNIARANINALNTEISEIQARAPSLSGKIVKIDDFIRKLFKQYRQYGADVQLADNVKHIELRESYAAAIGVRDAINIDDAMDMLIGMIDDMTETDGLALQHEVKNAKSAMDLSIKRFNDQLDELRKDKDIPDYVKEEIASAQVDPSLLERFYFKAQQTHDASRLAFDKAKMLIDKEWESVADTLKPFTIRLPANFKMMREIFSPKRDQATGVFTTAGYEIKADLVNISDIRDVLQDIVDMIERRETSMNGEEKEEKKNSESRLRHDIRSMFYARIFRNVSVKLCMPSISSKSITIEKKMVSSGQGVAMTLLWVIKMAKFVNERESGKQRVGEMNEFSLSRKSQFALIDGAFSHLSSKDLIDEALAGIGESNGKFQLLITVHDAHYKNDYKHFPLYITGHEISADRIMYAEHHSGTVRLIEPSAIGSHYGAMELMQHHQSQRADA